MDLLNHQSIVDVNIVLQAEFSFMRNVVDEIKLRKYENHWLEACPKISDIFNQLIVFDKWNAIIFCPITFVVFQVRGF